MTTHQRQHEWDRFIMGNGDLVTWEQWLWEIRT